MKGVIGPGTGLGEAFLVKSEFAPYYEICSSEGGHSEFAPRTDEDMELVKFAKKYVAESNNIENLRAKAVVDRISVERIGAGPAVPLLYKFMKEKYPDLTDTFEKEGKNFDEIKSYHIIERAMVKKDPLCEKVVEKFTEIFANETANLALKTLPYGGIYLIGGVTSGIKDYILKSDTFLKNFYAKGR